MRAETRDHHYMESGLENVWLTGLTVYVCPEGHELLAIPAMAKLHRAIALAIISRSERLTPAEVKYLRKYLGLSNHDFAKVMGISETHASRWASGAGMGASAENLLRILVLRGFKPESYPVDEMTYLKGLTHNPGAARIELRKRADDWQPVAVSA
jgi:DNA-binding transcriptional regulator YiaG